MARILSVPSLTAPALERLTPAALVDESIRYVEAAQNLLRQSYVQNGVRLQPPVGKIVMFRCGEGHAFYLLGSARPLSLFILPVLTGYRLDEVSERQLDRDAVLSARPLDFKAEASAWLAKHELFLRSSERRSMRTRRFPSSIRRPY